MNESDAVRLDANITVIKADDPDALPVGATSDEQVAVKDRFLAESVAEWSLRDRQTRAWELLLTNRYHEPPTWQQPFDGLPSEPVVEEFVGRYDALSAGAHEEYARRYRAPSAV